VLKPLRKKHNLWRKWQQNHDDVAYQRCKKLSNKASKKVRQAKKEFKKKIAQNIKNDSKSFYTYARSKTKV